MPGWSYGRDNEADNSITIQVLTEEIVTGRADRGYVPAYIAHQSCQGTRPASSFLQGKLRLSNDLTEESSKISFSGIDYLIPIGGDDT